MTLSHDLAGDGPAVVLLHAGVCDRRMWDGQWTPLIEAGFRVVRCDLRGFGDTPASAVPYNNADDVLGLLDGLGIERAALVGSSYGGKVAQEIAARRPERIDAMVLLCSAMAAHEASAELEALDEREEALVEAGDLAGAAQLMVETWVGPEAGDGVEEAVRRMQLRAYELQLASDDLVGPTKPEVDLGAITARSLVVSGKHDLEDFRRIAARLPELLTGAEATHVELEWAGHLPSMERPDEVTELLVAFLRTA